MKFTFDSGKDESNLNKHGISLSEAKFLDWDEVLNWIDNIKDYGEVRQISPVPMKQRLYCAVYVDAKPYRRMISLRKANNREIDRYEEEIN